MIVGRWPRKCVRWIRRARKNAGQPAWPASSWLSQSSVLAKRLWTMRTMQVPPPRASTLHSFANGGEPWKPSDWAIHFRGGSQAVTGQRISMPGPKFIFTATGFPSRTSNSAGTIQDEIPGPVAMACQTSSGVPVTSTSNWTDRRPEASFFTLMTAPWDRVSAVEGVPRPPGDACGRRGPVRCNRMLAGGPLPPLLGPCPPNNHRPGAGARERHLIASDGLVDQAPDLWTSECGRALHINRARLAAGPLQQFRRIRQFLTAIEVQLDAVRARADCQNTLVPVLVR